MGHFYETTLFETVELDDVEGMGMIGWQVLASPPKVDDQQIDYKEILSELGKSEPIERYGLSIALEFVGDLNGRWRYVGAPPAPDRTGGSRPWRSVGSSRTSLDVVERLMDEPIFAAETSPLRARSLAELAALASTSVVISLSGAPTIVFVGEAVGLVVIRPLVALGGALWEGAHAEVVRFGADTSATVLDALRQRLGIPRRGQT